MQSAELSQPDNPELLRRWNAYVEAAERAKRTQSVDDGIEAGHCWGAFLDMFLPPESPMPRAALRVVK